jgi:hypothetical protein
MTIMTASLVVGVGGRQLNAVAKEEGAEGAGDRDELTVSRARP